MPVVVQAGGAGQIVSKRGVEAERPAEEHHEILQGPVMLFVDDVRGLIDQRTAALPARFLIDQESAVSLPRGVEAGGVVQPAREHQNVFQSDAHGKKDRIGGRPGLNLSGRASGRRDQRVTFSSTDVADGCGRPPAGSSVTEAPTTGRGTFPGVSVTNVTRPDESGVSRPALNGPDAVSSQN